MKGYVMEKSKKKSQLVASLLALFLGGIGAHHFYLGNYFRGIAYLLLSFTKIPILLGWIDLFFIHKWIKLGEESNENIIESNSQPKIAQDNGRLLNKANNTNNSTKIKMAHGKRFYAVEDHIKPEYANLKTPAFILEDINKIKSGKKNVHELDNGMSFSVSFSGDQIIYDSIKYANERGNVCEHIPFKSYYTQFTDMNSAQKKWYFYWRESLLNKNYLETDKSYIILFIYELLNYSFNQEAAFNVSMLKTVSENYPEVSHYVDKWLIDMLYELDYYSSDDCSIQNEENHPLYNSIQKYDVNYEKMPISIWKQYVSNNRETVFFANYKNTIYKIFKNGLVILNDYYEAMDSSLLNQWFSEHTEKRRCSLYQGAVVARNHRESRSYYVLVRALNKTVSKEITALYKTAENITRELFIEKRKVKVELKDLPADFDVLYKSEIDKMYKVNDKGERFKLVKAKSNKVTKHKIPPPPQDSETISNKEEKNIKLLFDTEKISELHHESNEVAEIFNDEDNKDVDKKLNDNTEEIQPEHASFNDLFDDESGEIDEFLEVLSSDQIDLIKLFKNAQCSVELIEEHLRNKSVMPAVFISELNEKAVDVLDDNLISIENEMYIIDESYAEIVERIGG